MAEAKATVQQEWVDRHYTQGQPKDKRRNFLRSCNYAMFRGLVRSGEIDQHLETNANECRQHAEALTDQGHLLRTGVGRGPRGCICSTATCARGQGEWQMRPPQRISPDTDTAWNSNIKALQGRTCTLLGPSSTTWWQDTSWPRPTIWRGWPTCRHHGRPRPFSRCDCPGRSARKWLDKASDPLQTTPE